MAMAVACVGMAAKLKGVQWQFSFPTKHRVKLICEPCWCSNCEPCGCSNCEIHTRFLLLGAGLLLCWVVAVTTVGSCLPRASRRASAAFTMAAAILWLPAPIASRMEGGRRIRNMARNRSVSRETPRGRCCLSFLMRTLGLRPRISTGRRSNSK